MKRKVYFVDREHPENSFYHPPGFTDWQAGLEVSPEQTRRCYDLALDVIEAMREAYECYWGPALPIHRNLFYFLAHSFEDIHRRSERFTQENCEFVGATLDADSAKNATAINWISCFTNLEGLHCIASEILKHRGVTVLQEKQVEVQAKFESQGRSLPLWLLRFLMWFAKGDYLNRGINLTDREIPGKREIRAGVFTRAVQALSARSAQTPVNYVEREEFRQDLESRLEALSIAYAEPLAGFFAANMPKFMAEQRPELAKLSDYFVSVAFTRKPIAYLNHSLFIHPWSSYLAEAVRKAGGVVVGSQHGGGYGLLTYQYQQDQCEAAICDYYIGWSERPFLKPQKDVRIKQVPFQFRASLPKTTRTVADEFTIAYLPNHMTGNDGLAGSTYTHTFLPETFWATQVAILDELKRFVEEFKEKGRKVRVKLKLKNFPKQHEFRFPYDHPALKEPEFEVLESSLPMVEVLAQSNVALYDSFQTGFTEALAYDIPAISYYPKNLEIPPRLREYSTFLQFSLLTSEIAGISEGLQNVYNGNFKDDQKFQDELAHYRKVWCGIGSADPKERMKEIMTETWND